MACKTYGEAMEVLNSALTFGIDASLDGMFAMMEEMGNPQHSFASVQVAGTNGKTSTSRTTAALLHAHGYKVGLYTSPELVRYPERFEINGKVISDELFVAGIDAAARAADAVMAAGAAKVVTEFELLTVAAFYIFAQEQVDYAVLECGMGGRWDATSVVNPKVAVVCGIGLDHTAILGDTLEAITGEKAAIIKPGSTAVVGPGTLQPEVLPTLLARAAQCDTTLRVVYEDGVGTGMVKEEASGEDAPNTTLEQIASQASLPLATLADVVSPGCCTSFVVDDDAESLSFAVCGALGAYGKFKIDQPRFQAANISTAIAAVEAALNKALDPALIQQVLDGIVFPGRFETLRREPLLIIDAAHNPQSAQVLAQTIQRRFSQDQLPTILLAVLADKDAEGIVRTLAPHARRMVVTKTSSHRALPIEDLALLVTKYTGQEPETYATPAEAVAALKETGEPVVASGSITLAGAVKALFMEEN